MSVGGGCGGKVFRVSKEYRNMANSSSLETTALAGEIGTIARVAG